jgi:UDP:flavonoid glycosyltransferase YjiC (YdhE family)
MRIFFAWELGAGFGHVAPMRVLAQHLRERGHQCVFAVSNLDAAARFLEPDLGTLLQAPIRLNAGARAVREQLSYASILHNSGFDDAAGLVARLRAWRALIEQNACDCVIADHAPTAILAARTLSLPTAVIGTGFTVPPPTSPFPSFRHDLQIPTELLARNDDAVLGIANAALERLDAAPLPSLQAIFESCFPALFTYRELDHYACERPAPYLGVPDFSHGADVTWGERREPRIFAYLRPFDSFHALLQTLHALPCQVLLRVSEVDPATLAKFVRPGFVIVDREVHMRRAAETCDAFINYAAHGTVAEMLLAGKPGLLTPYTREQTLLAQRVSQLGATLTLSSPKDAVDASLITRLLEDPSLRSAAQTFATRYASQARERILSEWCDGFLEKVMAAGTEHRHIPSP